LDYARRLAAGEGVTGEDISDTADCAYSADQQQLIFAAIQEAEGDPKTLSEAQARSDWPRWKEAMDRELATLEKAETWSTVPCPPDKNVVGSKWVFRIKRKADGSIEKYKARLVARGFTQVYGVDYFDTFSPVAKLASFRTILAIAAKSDWEIKSFDFNGAYLNGELDEHEEIYMQFPPGYDTLKENMVKRLHKSLYGLKQAGRRWYDTLARALAARCQNHARSFGAYHFLVSKILHRLYSHPVCSCRHETFRYTHSSGGCIFPKQLPFKPH